MSTSIAKPNIYTHLRSQAESRLKDGSLAGSNWSLGVDALQLLHKLSSSSDTAADALKLLHELQVHQIELDLQREEMQLNELRLIEDSSHYRELYDSAPIAYFLIDFDGNIIESNIVGSELFGATRAELSGSLILRFLLPESQSVMLNTLAMLAREGSTQNLRVVLTGKSGMSRSLHMVLTACPDRRCVMLACCECEENQA